MCVYVRGKREGEKEVFPPQQSVGSAFTVAEQSGRHSQPAGSTWHAISSAPGTLAAQPAQPKHTSTGDQNNAKQTHAEHTDNMWGEEGGEWAEVGGHRHGTAAVWCVCHWCLGLLCHIYRWKWKDR